MAETLTLRTELEALLLEWEAPVRPTSDDPDYDNGRESARRSCADQLREILERDAQ